MCSISQVMTLLQPVITDPIYQAVMADVANMTASLMSLSVLTANMPTTGLLLSLLMKNFFVLCFTGLIVALCG
jgi:hypothetical protein